jgi:hypothetical protein
VNAHYSAALGTSPARFFVFNEALYAGFPYVPEVLYHAHAILGPVSFIQLLHPGAGKGFTFEAEIKPAGFPFLAVLDAAGNSGFLLEPIVFPAARAYIFIPDIGHTETAIHAAGGNQPLAHRQGVRVYLFHVGFPVKVWRG